MTKRKPIKPERGTIHDLNPIPKEVNEVPFDNRIIIKEDAAPSVRESGLILPAESAVKPYTGVIVAIGPQCEVVQLHDQVRYAKRAGDVIEIAGEEYLMLRETDCYTTLNK